MIPNILRLFSIHARTVSNLKFIVACLPARETMLLVQCLSCWVIPVWLSCHTKRNCWAEAEGVVVVARSARTPNNTITILGFLIPRLPLRAAITMASFGDFVKIKSRPGIPGQQAEAK
jgi:hypothetical protein